MAYHKGEAISNSKIKNTAGFAPSDYLTLFLIYLLSFSFRLSFPYLPLSFTHPFRHSRASGNPGRIGSRISPLSFPWKRESRQDWIPNPKRFAFGWGWQRVCHSRQNGNPGRTRSPIRSASLSVEDDKGCVIPAPLPSFPWKRKSRPTGSPIKCGMTKRNVDPQSEALCFRLRMTRGQSVEDDKRAFGWGWQEGIMIFFVSRVIKK